MGSRPFGNTGCYDGDNAQLVERLIGTSYDVVKAVAYRLPEVRLLAARADDIAALALIRNDLLSLVPHIEGLDLIAQNIDEIINGTKPASTIIYNGVPLDQVLQMILYQPIVISNFVSNPPIAEVGSAVQSVTLTWNLTRSGTSQKINGQTISPDARTFTSNVPAGADTQFVLVVEETIGDLPPRVATQAATLKFRNRRYWGASVKQALTDADIRALSNEFADDFTKKITFDATGGRYLYYCYPASMGIPTRVRVQDLIFSDYTVTTRQFINSFNAGSNYNILRLNSIQTGSNIEVSFA